MPHLQPEVDIYALKRDFSASTRLSAQFYLWKETLQYNLHPSIPITDNIRIADVATGNGVWLLDLARSLPPTVQLDGFDISLDQCPPEPWLPRNIQLHTWDVFTDPPPKFVGAFDVVHVRLITLVIKDNNPCRVISNLCKLLKPGGYLQWDEVDTLGSYVESVDPSVSTDAINCVRNELCAPGNSRGPDEWKRDLLETLDRNGFQESKLFRHVYDLIMARFWNDMYMATWNEFARTVLQRPDETSKLGFAAMEEVRSGSAIVFPKLVWVAKRTV
ncbi:hypothetical protein MMC20_008144 [Loxospora ochrophaea]|nr:hypothetical protein [Loxospora ochrophaea]